MPDTYFRSKSGNVLVARDGKLDADALTASYKPDDWPYPLPFLKAMAKSCCRERYCDVSITELCGDVQPSILKRRHDVVIDPESLLEAADSTAWHEYVASAAGETESEHEVELVTKIDGLSVGGRLDFIRYVPESKEIVDWKKTKLYKIARCLKGGVQNEAGDWWEQLQHYATLAKLVNDWDVKVLKLTMQARDWSEFQAKKDGVAGKVTTFVIDPLPPELGLEFLRLKVEQWKLNMDKPDEELDKCADTWGTDKATGLPRRCSSWCNVSPNCKQYEATLAKRIK